MGLQKNVNNSSILVQVLPKGHFGEMISFELHLEKWHNKTPKPPWFRGFPNRYLFRFALLVAGTGLEPVRAASPLALLWFPVLPAAGKPPCQSQTTAPTTPYCFVHRTRAALLPREPFGRRFNVFSHNKKNLSLPYGKLRFFGCGDRT